MADYIDREKYCNEFCHCNQNYCDKLSCPIWKAPSEKVIPIMHGHWIKYAGNLLMCSVCGCQYLDKIECDNYCGNCGAKMDETTLRR